MYDGCVQPKHCMQFADDRATVIALESDNQYLSIASLKCSSWGHVIVKVNKGRFFWNEQE